MTKVCLAHTMSFTITEKVESEIESQVRNKKNKRNS